MASSSIQQLPADTACLLGASAVVVSPEAVVKELVDNALDAGATLIEIVVAPDTLAKISVKDNGTGIDQTDFDHLGKRSHTSKLTSFEELRDKGGSTLGFRGEALASMAAVGSLVVTTRSKNSPVASVLEVKPSGGVTMLPSTHGPVGTTVILSKLFDQFPVRMKVYKKGADNTLRKVKKLIQSYTFARPGVKMIYKVHDSNKTGLTYNPGWKPRVGEAVMQVLGHTLARHCIQRKYQPAYTNAELDSESSSDSDTEEEDIGLTFDAFWPAPGAPVSRISNFGAFISIDGRPISTVCGVGLKIYETFRKACVAGYNSQFAAPTSPFMQLNIRCPAGSYDPNVDPLKERLIFGEEEQLIYHLEEMCEKFYSAAEKAPGSVAARDIVRPSAAWPTYPPVSSLQSSQPTGPSSDNGEDDDDVSLKQPQRQRPRSRATANPLRIKIVSTTAKTSAPSASSLQQSSLAFAKVLAQPLPSVSIANEDVGLADGGAQRSAPLDTDEFDKLLGAVVADDEHQLEPHSATQGTNYHQDECLSPVINVGSLFMDDDMDLNEVNSQMPVESADTSVLKSGPSDPIFASDNAAPGDTLGSQLPGVDSEQAAAMADTSISADALVTLSARDLEACLDDDVDVDDALASNYPPSSLLMLPTMPPTQSSQTGASTASELYGSPMSPGLFVCQDAATATPVASPDAAAIVAMNEQASGSNSGGGSNGSAMPQASIHRPKRPRPSSSGAGSSQKRPRTSAQRSVGSRGRRSGSISSGSNGISSRLLRYLAAVDGVDGQSSNFTSPPEIASPAAGDSLELVSYHHNCADADANVDIDTYDDKLLDVTYPVLPEVEDDWVEEQTHVPDASCRYLTQTITLDTGMLASAVVSSVDIFAKLGDFKFGFADEEKTELRPWLNDQVANTLNDYYNGHLGFTLQGLKLQCYLFEE